MLHGIICKSETNLLHSDYVHCGQKFRMKCSCTAIFFVNEAQKKTDRTYCKSLLQTNEFSTDKKYEDLVERNRANDLRNLRLQEKERERNTGKEREKLQDEEQKKDIVLPKSHQEE